MSDKGKTYLAIKHPEAGVVFQAVGREGVSCAPRLLLENHLTTQEKRWVYFAGRFCWSKQCPVIWGRQSGWMMARRRGLARSSFPREKHAPVRTPIRTAEPASTYHTHITPERRKLSHKGKGRGFQTYAAQFLDFSRHILLTVWYTGFS